jgi:hypothetical protein
MQDEMLIEENHDKKASEAGLTDLLLYELTTMNETFVTERALSRGCSPEPAKFPDI